ncbi:MAG: hypothetical protein ABIO94_02905, partial [Opitutaceae bacterium]
MVIPAAIPGRNIWLRVGTLLDGSSTVPLRDVHVVYNANKILFVGADNHTPPANLLQPGQIELDVHEPAATLLPGLIEAHAHLFLEGGELDAGKRAAYLQQTPAQLLAAARERLPKLARYGIAGVRDAGDKDGVGLALSKLSSGGASSEVAAVSDRTIGQSQTGPTANASTRALMPYVESPGAAIHHQGRYGSFMADAIEKHASLRAVVEARVAAGADRIKLIPTGIINFKKGAVTSEPQMTTAEVTELVAAAKS